MTRAEWQRRRSELLARLERVLAARDPQDLAALLREAAELLARASG